MEKEYLFVLLSALFFGTIVFGGQIFVEMGLSVYEISIFRIGFVLVLVPIIFLKKKYMFKKSMIPMFIIFGIIEAVAMLTQFGALVAGAPVAIVVFLLYTQPLWTSILGKILLNEKFTRNKILAVVFSLIGVGIMINPFNIGSSGILPGVILGLISGIAMSLWIIYSRKAGKKKLHAVTTTTGWAISTLIFLSISYVIAGLFIDDISVTRLSLEVLQVNWFYLFIFTVVSIIIPFLLFMKGMKKVSATSSGIILLLEPIAASLLAWFFLSQPLTTNIIIGGALILAANYLVVIKK
jgi:drug/metabolite transporter (DMT)-like permease